MKACLDEQELLRLWAADAGEMPDDRAHVAQCARCSAGYDQLTNEAGTITNALTNAADHLHWRERRVRRSSYARIGESLRTAVVFSGAAALGGAAAFALLVALGWHPGGPSRQIAKAYGNTMMAENTANPVAAAPATASADGDLGAAYPATGSLYNADAVTSDPLAGAGDDDSVQSGGANAGSDELLFCVPGDDSAMCSPSPEQG